MTITKEASIDLQEKYKKVTKLLEEDSKNDPEHDPYHSKYKAKEILIGMKANIENLLRQSTNHAIENNSDKLQGMLGAVLFYLSTVAIDTDEITMGEKQLTKCEEVIKDHLLKPEFILTTINVYNIYGIIWCPRDSSKSLYYLLKAEFYYKEFKKTDKTPVDIPDLFSSTINPENGMKSFEKLYTLTLYYLAQIYGKLEQPLKSAYFCHITLKRQLEGKGDELDHVEWALNAATLSQFFIERNAFTQARHHLAASSHLLNIYKLENHEEANTTHFEHRSADIDRCWAKYGIVLMGHSRNRLMQEEEPAFDLNHELEQLNIAHDDWTNFKFNLELTELESQVTDQFLLTFEDAKKVFTNVIMWLKEAQNYYSLEDLASDYIEIIQDQSQAYLKLLFFEDNPDNQAKMHKRRIDILEGVLKNINPLYYLPYCRQMWFELSQIYEDILEIKMEKIKGKSDRPSPHAVTKINCLIDKALYHLNKFTASFKEKKIDVEYEKSYLQAYFLTGALYGRYITLDKTVLAAHAQSSLDAYKRVIEYCKGDEELKKTLAAELAICKEMRMLLPLKIAKLNEQSI